MPIIWGAEHQVLGLEVPTVKKGPNIEKKKLLATFSSGFVSEYMNETAGLFLGPQIRYNFMPGKLSLHHLSIGGIWDRSDFPIAAKCAHSSRKERRGNKA